MSVEEFDDRNIFLVVWDVNGLEAIVDVQESAAADTMSLLKGEKAGKLRSELNYFLMRARFNSHRHYEIYSVHTSPEITEEDLRGLFEADPQIAVDLIRERGTMLYSDRLPPARTVIR